MIKETIDLLGHKATDKVTGYRGVITSACFDLYGCVQVAINPPAKKGEELKSGSWFDVNRVEVSTETVMPVPDFDAKGTAPEEYRQGCSDKPSRGV